MNQPNPHHWNFTLPTRVRTFRLGNLSTSAQPHNGPLAQTSVQNGMQWGEQGPPIDASAAGLRHTAGTESEGAGPNVVRHEGLAANRRERSKIKPNNSNMLPKARGPHQSMANKPIDIVQHNPCVGEGWNKRHSKQKPREKQSEEEKKRRKGMVEHGSCISCAYRKKQCDRQKTCDRCHTNKWTCIRWPEEAWLWNKPWNSDTANDIPDSDNAGPPKEARLEEARNMSFHKSQEILSSPEMHSALHKHGPSLTIKSRTRSADSSVCDEFTTDCESLKNNALCFDLHKLAWSELDNKIASHIESPANELKHQILCYKEISLLYNVAANLKAVLHSSVYCRPGQIDFAKAVATLLMVRLCKMLAFAAQSISEMICVSIRTKGGDLLKAQKAIAMYYCVVEGFLDALDANKLTADLKQDLEKSVATTHEKLIALFALTERCVQKGKKRGPRGTLKTVKRIITGSKPSTKGVDEEAAQDSLERFMGCYDIDIKTCLDLQIAIIPDPSTTQPNNQPFVHPYFAMSDLLNSDPRNLAESLGSNILPSLPPVSSTPLSPILGSPSSETRPTWNVPASPSTAPSSPGRVSLKQLQGLSPHQPPRKRLAVHAQQSPASNSSQSDTVVESSTDATTITGGPLSPEPEPTNDPLSENIPEKPPTTAPEPPFEPPALHPPRRPSDFVMEREFGGPLSPVVHNIGYTIERYYRHDSFKTLAMHPKRQSTSGSESSVASLAQVFHRKKRMHIASGLSDRL